MADTFFFSYFFRLKPNLTKSKTACIRVLKGVQVEVCGIRYINLNNETLNILGTHFSYNEKLKEEKKINETVTYSKSIGNTKKKNPYTRRESRYFKKNSDIKNYFPIIYKMCPKA